MQPVTSGRRDAVKEKWIERNVAGFEVAVDAP